MNQNKEQGFAYTLSETSEINQKINIEKEIKSAQDIFENYTARVGQVRELLKNILLEESQLTDIKSWFNDFQNNFLIDKKEMSITDSSMRQQDSQRRILLYYLFLQKCDKFTRDINLKALEFLKQREDFELVDLPALQLTKKENDDIIVQRLCFPTITALGFWKKFTARNHFEQNFLDDLLNYLEQSTNKSFIKNKDKTSVAYIIHKGLQSEYNDRRGFNRGKKEHAYAIDIPIYLAEIDDLSMQITKLMEYEKEKNKNYTTF